MGSNIQGQFYSNNITTGSVTGNEDLISDIRTTLGLSNIIAKKLSIRSGGSISVDINNLGTYSTLYETSDSGSPLYRLDLDAGDCNVSSLKIKETNASVWISIIY